MKKLSILLLALICLGACRQNEITTEELDGYTLIHQTKGPTLGFTSAPILNVDGFAFKDLNRNGELDVYEDWRKDVQERAANLASQLTLEEICGLMLYSSAVDAVSGELSQEQMALLDKDHIRHMLIRNVASPAIGAQWSNAVQVMTRSSRVS